MGMFHKVEKILKILNTWQSIHKVSMYNYFSDILKIIVDVVTISEPTHAIFIYD